MQQGTVSLRMLDELANEIINNYFDKSVGLGI